MYGAQAAGSTSEVKYGTIGAVAVDSDGHVASATSTGGLTGKRWGRIGDSPLIGAGTYADDRVRGGLRDRLRRSISSAPPPRMKFPRGCALAAKDCSRRWTPCWPKSRRSAAIGGLIAVAPSGEAAWSFTTPACIAAWPMPSGSQVAIYAEELER